MPTQGSKPAVSWGEKKGEYKKEWEEGRAGERGRWQIIVKDQIEIFLFSVIRNIKDH